MVGVISLPKRSWSPGEVRPYTPHVALIRLNSSNPRKRGLIK